MRRQQRRESGILCSSTQDVTPPYSQRATQEEPTPESPILRVQSLRRVYETCNFTALEPENYKETSKEKAEIKALKEEIETIEKNETWEQVDCPKDRDHWRQKGAQEKLNADGSIQKHKT